MNTSADSCSAITPTIIAVHEHHGLMAATDATCVVRLYKRIDAPSLGINCRPDHQGRQRGWIQVDARDLPARTGIRSKVISMQFSPDGTRLLVATTGRDAITTLRIDPESGNVLEQSCNPPCEFKV